MHTVFLVMLIEVGMALTLAWDLVRWARSLPPLDQPQARSSSSQPLRRPPR